MNIGDEIHHRLSRVYRVNKEEFLAPRLFGIPLFEFVIAVVLSQNTSDKNAWRAYENLRKVLGEITPDKVIKLHPQELAELIKPAGMHNERATRILELARKFLENDFEGEIKAMIEREGVEKAKETLMKLPGIGDKTADVILLMYFNKPVFPIDTHISRITRRLGYIASNRYRDIQDFWMKNTSPEKYLELHLLLISHGRKTCRPRRPLCEECILKDMCRFKSGAVT